MSDTNQFHLYQVETEEGPVSMIAVLPPEHALAVGLPEPAVLGTVPTGAHAITPDTFTPNTEFLEFLHHVIARYGHEAPDLQDQAHTREDGWIYMVDLRIGDADRAIDEEDIFGAFQVVGGQVVPGSYRANPDYLPITQYGVPRFSPWLLKRLIDELLRLE